MTSEQRQALRRALEAQGLTRTQYTEDPGDGAYGELWKTGQDAVLIAWGPVDR